MSANWLRVSRARHCPICDRADWCLIAADGSAAICTRVESDRRAGEGGWLHKLRDTDARSYRPTRRVIVAVERPRPSIDFGELAASWAVNLGLVRAAQLAGELGVSELSLHRLACGWDGVAFTFPMRGADGRVCGIRRRLPDGRKLSVTGGREGLFIPANLSADGCLLICEGPTDTAAMLDLNFAAVGRPSCTGGTRLCCEVCKGRSAAIVADTDPPGTRGAAALASVLRLYCPSVRVIYPPDGLKDARAWVNAGASASDVQAAIDAADVLKLGIQTNTTAGRGRRIQGISSCLTATSYSTGSPAATGQPGR